MNISMYSTELLARRASYSWEQTGAAMDPAPLNGYTWNMCEELQVVSNDVLLLTSIDS